MAVYCNADDLSARLSAAGVELRADDDPDWLAEVIDEASATVDFYLNRHYDPDNFGSNRSVKHWTANIAVMLLCERRANPVPASITDKYERTLKELEKVQAGAPVPGLTPRRSPAPQLSNLRIKLGNKPHVVVSRETSPRRDRPRDYRQPIDPVELPQDYNP